MGSKMVLDREKSARSVTTSLRTNGPEVADAFTARLKPHLKDGEEMPDVALLFELMARHLDAKTDAMTGVDREHNAQLGERAEAINEREGLIDAIMTELEDTRQLVTGLYRSETSRKLTLAPAPARDAEALKGRLKSIVENLAEFAFGESRINGASLDPAALATRFGEQLQRLQSSLTEVAQEHKETSASQRAKNAAMDDYDNTFHTLASLTEHFYRAVDEHLLARDVRPSSSRRGRTNVSGDTDDSGDQPT